MRAAWIAAALVLCAGALIVSAFAGQRKESMMPAARIGATIAGGDEPQLAYTGPRRLSGEATLRARVRPASAIVAMTYLLDGEPLGTATAAPYALDVDASLLPAGRHRIRVEAVDRLGARTRSRVVRVRTGGTPPSVEGPDALGRLAGGHTTVRLGPGRYPIPHIEIGSGARLVGSGPDTVLVATSPSWSLLTVGGRDVRVSDLTIDGAGLAERGIGVASGSHDVRLQHVRIGGIRETGVEIWGNHSGVSVQDSAIEGGGAEAAGVFDFGSDSSRDTSVIRTDITGFRGYGINFVQRAYDRPAAALHALALDNRISNIDDPSAADGTHEGGIWSGGVAAAIIGNRVHDTGWDGIQTVGSSRRVTIVDNEVARTRTGIYLEHETTGSLIARNVITDVATGINSEWRYGNAGSGSNTLERNTVVRPTETGIFIDDAGDRNRIAGNLVVSGSGPAVVLQGASDNIVTGTRACERPGAPIVREQSAHYDDGVAAHSLRNRIAGNGPVDACPPP